MSQSRRGACGGGMHNTSLSQVISFRSTDRACGSFPNLMGKLRGSQRRTACTSEDQCVCVFTSRWRRGCRAFSFLPVSHWSGLTSAVWCWGCFSSSIWFWGCSASSWFAVTVTGAIYANFFFFLFCYTPSWKLPCCSLVDVIWGPTERSFIHKRLRTQRKITRLQCRLSALMS